MNSLISDQPIHSGRGGARPGAGRPRKFGPEALGPVAAAEAKIRDKLPMIVDRMLELVEGVTVSERDSHGQERIYTRPPDREAGKYLMDRVMGKPTQPLSNDNDSGAPLFTFAIQRAGESE